MIGRVYRGSRPGGLLRYLYGPGRCNEHVDPHLVASWDGAPDALVPRLDATGHRDVRMLTALLEQPLAFAERPGNRPVWHCALRAAPDDRILTDDEWAEVAVEVMDRTGIAPRGDDGACRWIAVRHAGDHVHVVAVLARQDGAGVRLWRDFPKLRAACRAAEDRYGLRVTAAADGTVPPRPTRAETEKAARRALPHAAGPRPSVSRVAPPAAAAGPGRPSAWDRSTNRRPPRTAREQLRIAARRAAAAAGDPQDFLSRLRAGGVLVKERHGERGELTGYAVAVPTDRAADGQPVFFGGGKLAADLSLPRLQRHWAARASAPRPPGVGPSSSRPLSMGQQSDATTRSEALRGVVDAATAAAVSLRTSLQDDGAETAAAAAYALAAAGQVSDRTATAGLLRAAELYEYAARAPRGHRSGPGSRAASRLSAAALLLARSGGGDPQDSGAAVMALLLALSALTEAVAAWHAECHRSQQAAAAQAAADELRQAAAHVKARHQGGVGHRAPSAGVPTLHRAHGAEPSGWVATSASRR